MIKPFTSLSKAIIIHALLLFICKYGYAQYSLQGKVLDSITMQSLTDANVQLFNQTDTTPIKVVSSIKAGAFVLKILYGNYTLITAYTGYKTDTLHLAFNEATASTPVRIFLSPSITELTAIFIKAEAPPIVMKNDTLVFNASRFKVPPGSTVEDLLKKLPGVQVDNDGNVMVNGEKVQKIYVDGKPFFLDDPKLTTQNLLADMVSKIEAYEDKADKTETGFGANTLNLQLRPGKKKGYFGTAMAGYGNEDRYMMSATGSYFRKDLILYFSAGASNTGIIPHGKGFGSILNLPAGENKKEQVLLNYRDGWGKKLSVVGNYNFNNNRTQSLSSSERSTFLQDSSLFTQRESGYANKSYTHRVAFNLNYVIDSFNILQLTSSVLVQQSNIRGESQSFTRIEKTNSSYLLNSAETRNNSITDNINSQFGLQYNRTFRKAGRLLRLDINTGYMNRDGSSTLYTLTQFYSSGVPTGTAGRDQQSNQDNIDNNYTIKFLYTEPVGKGQIIDLNYSFSKASSVSDKQTYSFNPATDQYDIYDSLVSNSFQKRNRVQQAGLSYNMLKQKFQYQLGLNVQHSLQDNRNISGNAASLLQSTFNIFPRTSFMYKFNKNKNANIIYSGRSNQPSIQQLQPLPDFSNPTLIKLGNPNLKQEFTHNIRLNYKNIVPKTYNTLIVSMSFSSISNRLVNSTKINSQGIQEQQYVNINGNYSVDGDITYRFSISKSEKNKLSISTMSQFRFGQSISFLNGDKNLQRSITCSPGIGIDYSISDYLDVSINARINMTNSSYSIQPDRKTTINNQIYAADVFWRSSMGLELSSNFSLRVIDSRNELPAQCVAIWNAAISKYLFKNRLGELRLSALDLLNRSSNLVQTAGDNYIETVKTEVPPQLFILAFVYSFRGNK